MSIVAAITDKFSLHSWAALPLGGGDVIGRRRAFALCICVYGLGTTLAAFAPIYPFFLGSRILAGLGIGGEFGLAFAMFSECWHTERRGLMGGTIQTMFIVGQIITQGVLYTLTMFGYDTGWRAGFLVLGIVSILLAFATLTWTPESHKWLRYQAEFERGTLPEELQRTSLPYADLFRGGLAGGTIAFMVIMTAIFMYSYSLGTFGPTFLLNVAKVPLGSIDSDPVHRLFYYHRLLPNLQRVVRCDLA